MFKPKQIISFNNECFDKLTFEQKKYQQAYDKASFIDRIRLDKYNHLISDIVNIIEIDSGWVYSGSDFTYKSNFKYDQYSRDICFFVNRVKKGSNGFVADTCTGRTNAFIQKYNKTLQRLFILEAKKQLLYNKLGISLQLDDKVVNLEQYKSKKEEKGVIDDYASQLANCFTSQFGMEGIIKLISLLNDFDMKDAKEVYLELIRERISSDYKNHLITWLQTYSNSYNQLIYDMERNQLQRQDNSTDGIKIKFLNRF